MLGCGDSGAGPEVGGAGGDREPGWGGVDSSILVEPVVLEGFEAPPNPSSGEQTPTELNQARFLRYRYDLGEPEDPRAIVIGVPGFLGGGASFDGVARSLVRMGAEQGVELEFWAIDRRSNGMEDLTGMNAAEEAGDPEIAFEYYFGDGQVDGAAFPGFRAQEDVGFMSEWGLQAHIEDIRAVLHRVPEAQRKGHVFLMGHSFGAGLVELYGAWRFEDGTRGADELAGMIFMDGLGGSTPISEEVFVDGVAGEQSGLNQIRDGSAARYLGIPILGVEVLAVAELTALRAWFDPTGIVDDPVRDGAFALLTGLFDPELLPAVTNRGALGLGFDADSEPLGFVRVQAGQLTGGPTEPFSSLLAPGETLTRPSDPEATYDWIDAADSDPQEYTPLRTLARAFTIGPSNFAEWYFPARLSLDARAAAGGALPEDAWQLAYGIAALDGPLNDAPALCVPGALVGDVDQCDALRDRLAPEIGPGRRHEGASRQDSELAFRKLDATDMAHLDVVLAEDGRLGEKVPETIADFLGTHVQPGRVSLP
jgi:hypothetical protein